MVVSRFSSSLRVYRRRRQKNHTSDMHMGFFCFVYGCLYRHCYIWLKFCFLVKMKAKKNNEKKIDKLSFENIICLCWCVGWRSISFKHDKFWTAGGSFWRKKKLENLYDFFNCFLCKTKKYLVNNESTRTTYKTKFSNTNLSNICDFCIGIKWWWWWWKYHWDKAY